MTTPPQGSALSTDFDLMISVAAKTDTRNEELRAMLQAFIGRMSSVPPSVWGGVAAARFRDIVERWNAESLRLHTSLARIAETIRDNERVMLQHMDDTVEELAKTAGIELVHYTRGATDRNGSAIHEHGTCRMGDDPKKSALNKFNQMHEVKNLFVVDGSAFTTASEKNPTITILSLAWRATDYLAEEMKRGNV